MNRFWSKGLLGCSVAAVAAVLNRDVISWDYNWDFMSTPDNANGNGKANMNNDDCHHIWLVRHGQYNMSMDHAQRSLTDLGKQQAVLTGQKLKQMNIKLISILPAECDNDRYRMSIADSTMLSLRR